MDVSALDPIALEHREVFERFLSLDPPEASEYTFTNLFMWRHVYRPAWLVWKDCLLILLTPEQGEPFGLEPVGPGDKRAATGLLFDLLRETGARPRLSRLREAFVTDSFSPQAYEILHDRDNSDYVYSSEDLIRLPGNRYHRKKNHLNRFLKSHVFRYRPLDHELVECVLAMQEQWCEMRACSEHPGLLFEDFAIREALTHFGDLAYTGAAIQIEDRIVAFTLGELLNPRTAVIHIEKADPEIPGLYAAINQLFCRHTWAHVPFINREQDLGLDSLRAAKASYLPHHHVNKYTVTQKET